MNKVIKGYLQKVKCAFDVTGKIITNGELKEIFEKFRSEATDILENDMKECVQAEGLLEKFK